MLDTVRYWIALILAMSWPAGLIYWVIIHPLVGVWRRVGPWVTYGVVALASALMMLGVWRVRELLMAVDYGFSPATAGMAVLCMATGTMIAVKRRRHLTPKVLAGVPEISPDRSADTLLTEGPYAVIRHPRYVEAVCFVLAYALFANFLVGYVVFLLSFPLIWLVVVLEERELADRFGPAYEVYRERVPRFIPRRGRHSTSL